MAMVATLFNTAFLMTTLGADSADLSGPAASFAFFTFSSLIGLFSVLMICIQLLATLLIIVGVGLWIWMLIDVIQREEAQFPGTGKDQKVMWILIIILTGYIGAAIYYYMVYRVKSEGKK